MAAYTNSLHHLGKGIDEMKAMSRAPSYLIHNQYSYCLRIRVPEDLHSMIGKKELRYSLKTGYLKTAKHRSKILSGQIFQLFDHVKAYTFQTMKVNEKDIQAIVDKYLKKIVKMAKEPSPPLDLQPLDSPLQFDEFFEAHISELESIRDDLKRNRGQGCYDAVEKTAQKLLKENGVKKIDRRSPLYSKLCSGLMAAEIKGINAKIGMMLGKDLDELKANEVPTIESSNPPESQILLSELIERYLDDRKQMGLKEKVVSEYRTSLYLLMEFLGDVPISSIDRKKIGEFKSALEKLPSNRMKKKQYRDKSFHEILAMDIPADDLMHISNIKKNFSRLIPLFEHGITYGLLKGENPTKGFHFKKTDDDESSRLPFTKDELESLFRSDDYLKDQHQHGFQFWSPILGLFTMARQTEIGQLRLDDFKNEKGLWVIEIKQDQDRSIKTKSGKRKIPLHPFLIDELNLIGYVNRLKQQGEERLFPELKRGQYSYGENISRWFCNVYRPKCGIEVPPKKFKDFHSFRKTVSSLLDEKRVHEKMFKQVFGHSLGRSTRDRHYIQFEPQKIFDEVICKIDFHEQIDLSHLKESRFVVG